ncbi:MAG: aminoacyl-tRNA hydrolase [Bdellovibrionales bacterium RIFOXYB1_FULL_37_110]|nr:MAG: aminoacyl-tRNA hydrolase [Bdellovibrionales bacterium RIFOXYA1_FULL_38_20]OFZ52238.1 MAG: aminoacyl-tRNA hydrolase [Bdellovibrionales bacterium RIFOXYC1_FULL_37_79]OFZ56865.1 MAG: aminoacyl-tRNA hydrolase [Bdellovibrionales bacterium RIFOXYB2_FULL_36_6]OFZ57225.1 MAG: aminoacyl-tRNA hydrolase [Bdellovibrionales bacterium RIFOXYB1_FULL_37_110]OFZ65227.1 MAG: aminoacyl-tRNA hydrolase [Bdellovibrionales bacterium RIFOXYD1_FULL_36_51]
MLIVALGNPGREYENTRHNIAWLVMDRLSFFKELSWKEKFKGVFASKDFGNTKFYFLKPLTFMNLSGRSISALISFYQIDLKNIIVLHDEMDLPFGTIAFKEGGGLAGHNGLKSIVDTCGSQDFKRIRLGVGRPSVGDSKDWVLSGFNKQESVHLDIYLDSAAKALEDSIKLGFAKAAGNYSRKCLVSIIDK